MVARRTDAPVRITDHVRSASRRLDDLARRQGRGTGAIRTDSGQVVELDPASGVPLLVSYAEEQPVGSALRFVEGGVEIRDNLDGAFRDLGARAGVFRDRVQAPYFDGDVGQATGGVGSSQLYGRLHGEVGQPGENWSMYGTLWGNTNNLATWNSAQSYSRHHGECGLPNEGWTYYGAVVAASSLRATKQDITPLENRAALDAVDDLDWPTWRYRPDRRIREDHDDVHVGPMVDDMVDHPVWDQVVRRDDDGNPFSYDQGSLVGVLGAALKGLRAEVRALGEQNRELRSEIARLRGAGAR